MRRLGCLLIAAGLLACGASKDKSAASGHHEHALEEDPSEGISTKTSCPTVESLDYDTFGEEFLQTYCLTCHSASISGAARNGAPDDHNFDRLEDIRALAEHMDQLAGAGPEATNTFMPPLEPRPTLEERRQLSEWLACGAP